MMAKMRASKEELASGRRRGSKEDCSEKTGGLSSALGEIETAFIQRFGISVSEVMQRLVTDEVLHEVDARHVHRLLAANDATARRQRIQQRVCLRVSKRARTT